MKTIMALMITESFTVSFVTNNDNSIEPITVAWKETFKIPPLKSDKYVTYGWYMDKDFKTKYIPNTQVKEDITLYAQSKTIDEVINNSVQEHIDRPDLVIQVKQILDQKNLIVDNNYNESVKNDEQAKKEQEQLEKETNSFSKDKELLPEYHNSNKNKLFVVTFTDEQNNFLYSIVAPYNRTIKITDSNDRLVKEYSVRQHTTIPLKDNGVKEHITEYYKVNNTIFIKVSPIISNNELTEENI